MYGLDILNVPKYGYCTHVSFHHSLNISSFSTWVNCVYFMPIFTQFILLIWPWVSPFVAESKHYSLISHVAVVYLLACLPKDKESTSTTSYSYVMSDSIKINLVFIFLLFW